MCEPAELVQTKRECSVVHAPRWREKVLKELEQQQGKQARDDSAEEADRILRIRRDEREKTMKELHFMWD
jgi:5,10-methylenetetrahydrofolate reductase